MMTYQQIDWLPWAIDQLDRALEFGSIDGVLIAEGGHSKQVPARSPDGSWNYLHKRLGKNSKYQIFDAQPFRDAALAYGMAQAPLLNYMCSGINRDQDTWLWYIHDDEFFFDNFLKNIKSYCKKHNKIMYMTKQMAFAFNMKLYWNKRTAYMLLRWGKNTAWYPITTPADSDRIPFLHKTDQIYFDPSFETTTFHFSHMKRSSRQAYRHKILPAEIGAHQAVLWHQEIYEKADLNNLGASYEKNREIMGGYGFYKDSDNLGPETMKILHPYNGPYPEVIADHPYMDIKDMRDIN
jgi:hypothetical protein